MTSTEHAALAQTDSSQLKHGSSSIFMGSPTLPTPIPLLGAHRGASSARLAGEQLKATPLFPKLLLMKRTARLASLVSP